MRYVGARPLNCGGVAVHGRQTPFYRDIRYNPPGAPCNNRIQPIYVESDGVPVRRSTHCGTPDPRLTCIRSKQKNFQTDCFVSAALASAGAQPDVLGKVMTIGTVKFFNASKGFGFIAPEDGGKDVFVHSSAVEMSGMRVLSEGQRVSFEIQADQKGPKAVNLQTA